MPTYEYRCAKCGEELEVFQTFAETPLTKHTGCGGKLAKVLSAGRHRPQGLGLLQDRQPLSSSKASRGTQESRTARPTPVRALESRLGSGSSRGRRSPAPRTRRIPVRARGRLRGRRRRVADRARPRGSSSGPTAKSAVTAAERRAHRRHRRVRRLGLLQLSRVDGSTRRGVGRHTVRPAERRRSPIGDGRRAGGSRSSPATDATTVRARRAFPPAPISGRCGARGAHGHRPVRGRLARSRAVHPGDFVVLDQLVDRTWGRPDTFYDAGLRAPRVVRRSVLPGRRGRHAVDAGERVGVRLHDRGTVVVMQGPRFSTRAESRLVSRPGLGRRQHDAIPGGVPRPRAGHALRGNRARHRLRHGRRARRRRGAAVTAGHVFAFFEANLHRMRALLARSHPPAADRDRPGCECADAIGPLRRRTNTGLAELRALPTRRGGR